MWLVQCSGTRAENGDAIMTALALKGIPYTPVGIRPFDTEIMGIEDRSFDGPVMVYGSTKLVRLAAEKGFSGVYFDNSTFNAMAWKANLHYLMANDYSFHQIKTLCSPTWEYHSGIERFLRPVMDLKLFAGSLKPAGMSYTDFFAEKLNGSTAYANTMVAEARPKYFQGEWRCFIVNRKLVTATQYRLNGELLPSTDTPEGLEEFVEFVSELWLPHDHCVMDVAMLDEEFRVMEFNCINASGLYKADVNKLVDALNSLMV